MNPRQSLEARLRGWKPAGPSPKLRQRLFAGGHPLPEPGRARSLADWHALALPVTACWMIAMVWLARERPSPVGGDAGAPALAALATSGQVMSAGVDATWHSRQNASPPLRLEWTNTGVIPSSIRSLPGFGTNLFQ